ncbi:hypothetical protein AB0C52_33120 [Streptomyces sp. NPDC048717]|uniref:hypothetical protein n=1 Tax=Streptomyces sp. NPDC048717 TaxID=3154928 RepID=UPI003421BFCC
MTAPVGVRPLNPSHLAVGRMLLEGETPAGTARRLPMFIGTVRRRLTEIGRRLGAATAVDRAVALLAGGHLPPPSGGMLTPGLRSVDIAVLKVLTKLVPEDTLAEDLRAGDAFLTYLEKLCVRCGARTDAHLVTLAAAWNLLPDLVPHPVPGEEQ